MQSELQHVYKILDYVITKAAVSGKLSKRIIRIPYADLLATIGQTSETECDLVIKISMKWDTTPEAKEE